VERGRAGHPASIDENIFSIVFTWLRSTSGSRAFDLRCLVTTLAAPQNPAFALRRGGSLHFCVLPLLVTSLARF
jgi:hypothetical protein